MRYRLGSCLLALLLLSQFVTAGALSAGHVHWVSEAVALSSDAPDHPDDLPEPKPSHDHECSICAAAHLPAIHHAPCSYVLDFKRAASFIPHDDVQAVLTDTAKIESRGPPARRSA